MNTRHFQRAILALTLALVSLEASAATTRYVNASNHSPATPYTSWATAATNIQDAVNFSASGDTVLVTNGIYQYGGTVDGGSNRVTCFNAVTIQSVNGPSVTIIKGYQVPGTTNGVNAVRCVYLGSSSAMLSGFTLTNGATQTGGSGGGVYASSSCTVSNCVIIGNACSDDGGGTYGSSSGCTNINCLIAGNVAFNQGGAAYASTLINCMVTNNFAPNGGGLAFGVANNCLFTGNGSTNNIGGTSGGAAYQSTLNNCTLVRNLSSAQGTAENCALNNSIIYYNSNNFYSDCIGCTLTNCCLPGGSGFPSPANNCISSAPAFVDFAHADYHLQIGSLCINAGTNIPAVRTTDLDGNPRIVNGLVDLGAYESQNTSVVHFVNVSNTVPVSPYTNWLTAATNIQDAVAVAQAGEFVVVSNGLYRAGGAIVFGAESNRVALTNPITLMSLNGSSSTVIVGNSTANGIRCAYVGSNAVLYGFTLVDGTTRSSGNQIKEESGGGAWCEASGVISNCVIGSSGFPYADNNSPGDACTANWEGSAVYGGTIYNSLIANNTISTSQGGTAAAANLINCVLTNNTCFSGFSAGIYLGTATNTTFNGNVNNSGSFASAGAAYQSTLYNCTFAANRGSFAGGASTCTNYSCTFTNNNGSEGGAAYAGVLYNCLLSSNSASSGGGAYQSTLYNCLVITNRSTGIGGGVYNSTLYSCTLSNNTASSGGGGAYSGTLFNCTLGGNYFSGAYGNAALYNCVLSGNTNSSSGGGALFCRLYDCLLVGNGAGSQGGGASGGSLYNCTVVGNFAPQGGGVANANLYNSICYYNACLFGADTNYINSTMAYCDTTPLAAGAGNITNDPALVNFPADLHLQSTSPCINSGDNSYVTTNKDFDSNPRTVGSLVDIGAYEFQSPTSIISYAWLQQYGLPTDGSADYLDSDGTGMPNWQKSLAGLNPTDPTSVLAMLSPAPTNNAAGVTVSWQSVGNRNYYLLRATDLTVQPAFSTIQSNLVGQAGSTTVIDATATGSGPYFYRVGVQ